ncbi:MAG: penicillin-insensitive murein endopeptidase [Polyangiaceae bacterium]
MISKLRAVALLLGASAVFGCAGPSSLAPQIGGSIGMTHRGILEDGEELPKRGPGYAFLRDNGRHFALSRFARAIAAAAASVDRDRPPSTLVLGDISLKHGGAIMPHFSHRNGRDADLVLYATTLEGAPIESPGFIHFGPDGLAWDQKDHRFLRFDVEREWLLVKALIENPEARIQWLFCNHVIEALLVEWARARGEPDEIVWRAEQLLLEPHPGGAHDDHIHVRTTCDANDIVSGCTPFGPQRPWLALPAPPRLPDDTDLARQLFTPLATR